jgi:hypothetical protein
LKLASSPPQKKIPRLPTLTYKFFCFAFVELVKTHTVLKNENTRARNKAQSMSEVSLRFGGGLELLVGGRKHVAGVAIAALPTAAGLIDWVAEHVIEERSDLFAAAGGGTVYVFFFFFSFFFFFFVVRLIVKRTTLTSRVFQSLLCASPDYLFFFKCKKILCQTSWSAGSDQRHGLGTAWRRGVRAQERRRRFVLFFFFFPLLFSTSHLLAC